MANTIGRVAKRAKAIRKNKPGMKWQNALKQAGRELRSGLKISGTKKKRRVSGTVVKAKPKTRVKRTVTVINGTKKRSSKKSTRMASTRRRSISGTKAGYTQVLIIGVGAVAGSIAARMAGNFMASKIPNPKAVAIAQIGSGAVISRMAKHPFIEGVGYGFVAEGATTLLQGMNVIKGPVEDEYTYVAGPTPESVADDYNEYVAETDDYEEDY